MMKPRWLARLAYFRLKVSQRLFQVRPPIAGFDDFVDLTSFVTVFLRFFRPVVSLTEGMFVVAEDFGDNVQ